MIYFYDTEFRERGDRLQFISIGIVAADGREFYAVDQYATSSHTDHVWLSENVVPRLQPKRHPVWRGQTQIEIARDLGLFIGDDRPEFWAYYGAHDWVVLCNLMGNMTGLPAGWPWLARDLRVELDRCGLEHVKDEGRDDEHNALADARWVRDTAMKSWGAIMHPDQTTEVTT